MTKAFGEVPHRVTWANLEGNRRYELWRIPEIGTGWHLYVFQNNVEITQLEMPNEWRARIEFEGRVARYIQNRGAGPSRQEGDHA